MNGVYQGCTYSLNEVCSLSAYERGNSHVCTSNPPVRHNGCILERGLAHEELVRQHTQTPQINLFVVVVVGAARLDHLRREVVKGTAEGLPPVVGGVHTPPEIRNLDLAVNTDEDVLGLNVPVDDVLAVQVAESRRHLGNILGRLGLGETVLLAEVLVQLALARELEDQEDAFAVMEVTEELEDVGVAEVALDFDLSADLPLHTASGLQLVLVQHLEGADEATRALPHEIDAAELALTQGFPDLEHAEMPLLGLRLLDELCRFPLLSGDLVGRPRAGRESFPGRRRRGRSVRFALGGLGRQRYRGNGVIAL